MQMGEQSGTDRVQAAVSRKWRHSRRDFRLLVSKQVELLAFLWINSSADGLCSPGQLLVYSE